MENDKKKTTEVGGKFPSGSESLISIEGIQREIEKNFPRARTVYPLPVSRTEFYDLIALAGRGLLNRMRKPPVFFWDTDNRLIADKLYDYSQRDKIDRGIALVGAFGCGKSMMMECFSIVNNAVAADAAKKSITMHSYQFITANDLYNTLPRLSDTAMKNATRTPLIIDELGREPKVGKDYGTEITPVIDLLFRRYAKGALTHITANFGFDSLAEMYGDMLADRFRDMFDFIEMKGKSRRG